MGVDDVGGRHDVALALAHLLALPVEDVPQRDDVAEARRFDVALGRRFEQRGGGVEAVEPAPRLVDALADVVGGVPRAAVDELFVLEGVVPLGEGHDPRIEPDVHHVGDAAHLAAAGAAVERDAVDVGAVQVEALVGALYAGLRADLVEAADGLGLAAGAALPHGPGRAPEALAGDRPVHVAAQPFAEASVLDVLGAPVDLLVGGEQAFADAGRPQVPRALGVVEQRRIAAPTERIGVFQRLTPVEQTAGLEVLDDGVVGVLDELARPRVALDELAAQGHRLHEEEPVLHARLIVVLAERRRGVDDARPVVHRDEVGGDDGIAEVVRRRSGTHGGGASAFELEDVDAPAHRVEQGTVARAGEIGAGQTRLLDEWLRQSRRRQRRRKDEPFPRLFEPHEHILLARRDAEAGVPRQRPRRRRPSQQIGGAAAEAFAQGRRRRLGQQFELHVDRGVGRVVLVPQRDLVGAQRRAAARAVGGNAAALVDEAAIP